MHGATAHEAAICEMLPGFQLHDTAISEAIPTPTRAPTIDWVVLTGKPREVQMASQVEDPTLCKIALSAMVHRRQDLPTSAVTIARIKTPGELLKGLMAKTTERMVEVTSCPNAIAPTNSVMVARHPACIRVKDLELTEVAYEFATS